MFRWLSNIFPGRNAGEKASKTMVVSPSSGKNSSSAEQLIQEGNAYLDQGLLDDAEKSYRLAIETEPANAAALVNLGYVLMEQRRIDEADACLRQATTLNPGNPDAHYLLGTIATLKDDAESAANHFETALSIKPDFEFALRDLCQLLVKAGHVDRARAALERGISANAASPNLYFYLGNLQRQAGSHEAALASFRKAASVASDDPAALTGIALALMALCQLDEAASVLNRALALDSNNTEAHYNLGLIDQSLDKLDKAIHHFRRAIANKLDSAEVWNSLGSALKAQGKLPDAAECFRKSIGINPAFSEAQCNLGHTLQLLKQFDQAASCYRNATSTNPGLVFAHNNLGLALVEQGKIDEAIDCLRRAAVLNPDDASIKHNLGCALREAEKLDEALENFRAALRLKPDYALALGNILFILSHHPASLPDEYITEARRYGELLTSLAQHLPGQQTALLAGDPAVLRVGFVSGDFKNHPVGFFLENILNYLNRDKIHLFAYTTVLEEDELTIRIKPKFTRWRSMAGMNDAEAARLICDDGIDILVDLSGHTAHNRLPLFAMKPAPVQASWLGYWASTGVAEIDFILTDPVSTPESARTQFTEFPWYLPDTRLCPSPLPHSPEVSPLPAFENAHLTFGCYQHLSKINGDVISAWGRICTLLPGSRLRIQNKQLLSAPVRESLLWRLDKHGISPDRVDMYGHVSREEYLETYEDVDMVLDTFPFPGGTTTCEALWMGVPTLTLAGDTLLSRQGVNLMSCVGLKEWIANDTDEYIRLAIQHASDLSALNELRMSLREKVLSSPLFDASRFAENLEHAFFGMWQRKIGHHHRREPGS